MNIDEYKKKTLLIFTVAGVSLLTLLLYALFLDEAGRESLVEEGGWVESASALGYFVCAVFAACKGKIAYLGRYHYFFMLLVFFMFRELDFHDKFTTMGIFKSRFYINDGVPFVEKLIGIVSVGVLLYIVFMILHRHLKRFLLGLKRRSPTAAGALITVVLVFASKLIDGIGRKLDAFGIEMSHAAISYAEAIEEILELGIPIFMFISFYMYFRQINALQDAAPDGDSAEPIVADELGRSARLRRQL